MYIHMGIIHIISFYLFQCPTEDLHSHFLVPTVEYRHKKMSIKMHEKRSAAEIKSHRMCRNTCLPYFIITTTISKHEKNKPAD